MSGVKTAISLDQTLFDEADALAHEMDVSRSRLFALALEEFIQRHRNRQLQARLNEAYAGEPDPAESERLLAMQRYHREVVGGEW